jgi:hypothetical protein
MKEIYKIIIACVITMTVTAFATAYFVLHHESGDTEMVCADNASPDINGCCPGEELTQLGDSVVGCCPTEGGDCFPPIIK